ncbi:MAG: hypothetical protein R2867_44115 [Caldilineaceae bacterium]
MRAIVMDHLAIGIDPNLVTFCLQSAIHETYELQLLISSLVTVERLQQLPTIKDMANSAGLEQIPYALQGYPVLQAADILLPRTWYRSAKITRATSKSRARLRGGSTIHTARSSRFPIRMWLAVRWLGLMDRPR